MWLINTKTLVLEEFLSQAPSYAILSHTWGKEEVTFVDWQYNLPNVRKKFGFSKIKTSCEQALKDGHGYLWCDTNCIDKRSSAELSEAINSMFKWYRNSAICYAYLADVSPGDMSSFSSSRWFTRGWTLQELLAPKALTFYANDWSEFGSRSDLSQEIFDVTKIRKDYMGDDIYQASVSERMSWVSHRETSRSEDIAYCMLGIFDINMPLLYGEGNKAFARLQEEIIRVSNDQSIFCWHWDNKHVPRDWSSMLSPSPRTFENSGSYRRAPGGDDSISYSMTNSGLSINLSLVDVAFSQNPNQRLRDAENARVLALLEVCYHQEDHKAAIVLERAPLSKRFVRFPFPPFPLITDKYYNVEPTTICVVGPRETGFVMLARPTDIWSPQFRTVITASLPPNVISIKPTPPAHSYLSSITLRPFTPRLFGAVFALTLTIKPNTVSATSVNKNLTLVESLTIFCFVAVDGHSYKSWRHCSILGVCAPPANFDIKKRISAQESRIIKTAFHSNPPSLALSGAAEGRFKMTGGDDFQIHAGPWFQTSEGIEGISVTHIAVPNTFLAYRLYYPEDLFLMG